MISESDWKNFKRIKEAALERFCETVLNDVSEGLSNKENTTNHGKYLYLYRLIENYDKQIALLFNDHSRSKAPIQLMMLRGEGLVKEEELENLSGELKEHTKPEKYA
ncbi:hypothetical protein [Aurantivibrio infirmus]